MLKQNENMSSIIQGNLLPNCNFIIAGNMPIAEDIMDTFDTVVRVDGFTLADAETYVSKWTGNANKNKENLRKTS